MLAGEVDRLAVDSFALLEPAEVAEAVRERDVSTERPGIARTENTGQAIGGTPMHRLSIEITQHDVERTGPPDQRLQRPRIILAQCLGAKLVGDGEV